MNPRASATSRVRAVERPGGTLGALRDFGDATERRAVAHGEVGEDLAVDLDVRALKAADQLTVRQAVLPRGGVDPDDPQLTHLALALLPVARGVRERMEERFAGRLDQLRSGAAATLRRLEQALVPLVGGDAPLDSCHRSWAPRGREACGGPAAHARPS